MKECMARTWELWEPETDDDGSSCSNASLMGKAIQAAKMLTGFSFVRSVGLFGSVARGERGNGIDIFALDDGTISDRLCLPWKHDERKNRYHYFGACSADFAARYVYGRGENRAFEIYSFLRSDVAKFFMSSPNNIAICFANRRIITDQEYLDELIWMVGAPYLFRNIQKDILLFNPETEKFGRDPNVFRFVNNGNPSRALLEHIRRVMPEVVEAEEEKVDAPGEDKAPNPIKEIKEYKCIISPTTTSIVGFDEFARIGGQSVAKTEIVSLASAINNPGRYIQWGTRPPGGVCLYGPPGTGKTLLAKALAKNIGIPFHEINASQMISKWYGESARNIDELFAKVRATGGIVFFDEADSLASSRDSAGNGECSRETKNMVDALCRNMDGFTPTDKVIVFFATNRVEDMDSAVMRAGRIDRIIEVPLPDEFGRQEIFDIHIQKAEQGALRKLFKKLDFRIILERTKGYSGADIAEIIRRALESKVRQEEKGRFADLVNTQDVLDEIISYERVKKQHSEIGFTKK